MIQLSKALAAWPSTEFNAVLKAEIGSLDGALLPLQQGLSYSSHANTEGHSASILDVQDEAGVLRVKAGLFYTGIIAGCSCADDPTPLDVINEYCVARFDIDKRTAETTITLLSE